MIPKTKTHNGVWAVISGPMPMLSLYVCGRCSFTAKVEQTWVFERVLHDCWL